MRAGQRIAITGPNGSGKTTLLRTIAGQIPPLAAQVRLGSSVRLGYMTQDQSSLDPRQPPLETILPAFQNQTEARRFLAAFLFSGDEPLKPDRPAELRPARPADAGAAGGGPMQLPAAG